MNAFRVWVRPLEYEYLICVDGVANARWLWINWADRSYFAAPTDQSGHELALCTFQVPCGPLLSLTKLQKLLAKFRK